MQALTDLGTNERSCEEASHVVWKLLRIKLDAKVIERCTRRIGEERQAECDRAVQAYKALPLTEKDKAPEGLLPVPQVVAVEIDGGCYLQREPPLRKSEESPATAKPGATPPATAEVAPATPSATGVTAQGSLEATAPVPAPVPVPEEPEEPDTTGTSSHWRGNKCGVLLKLSSVVSACDPCPEIPQGFLDIAYAGKLAQEIKHARVPEPGHPFRGEAETPDSATGSFTVDSTPATNATPDVDVSFAQAARPHYAPPDTVYRRVVACTENSTAFGWRLAAEAWSLGFYAAPRKAILGDGQKYNWTIAQERFSGFTQILDFIHLLTYVFQAAFAGRTREAGTPVYQQWIRWAWSGQTTLLISAMESRLAELGPVSPDEPAASPGKILARALNYIRENQSRMNYPEYRRQGLPITTCLVESTIKQLNHRVKGTEKHWSKPGVSAILQLRGDCLSSIHTLDEFWTRREAAATGQRTYHKSTSA